MLKLNAKDAKKLLAKSKPAKKKKDRYPVEHYKTNPFFTPKFPLFPLASKVITARTYSVNGG
jgi:hypothetical protein